MSILGNPNASNKLMFSTNWDNFTFSLTIWMPLKIFFSCLTDLARRYSNTLLKGNGKSGCICLVPDHQSFPFECVISYGLVILIQGFDQITGEE